MAPIEFALDGGPILKYWPTFLCHTQASYLFSTLAGSALWQQHQIQLFGKSYNEPRLSAFVGEPDLSYRYSKRQRHAAPWPQELKELLPKLEDYCAEAFNSALMNYYRDGDDCMGWHSDDEPELGKSPVIASVSLGCERAFKLRHKYSGAKTSINLTHGSLLLMPKHTQAIWQHSIGRSRKVNGPRINLTFRKIIPKPV